MLDVALDITKCVCKTHGVRNVKTSVVLCGDLSSQRDSVEEISAPSNTRGGGI